MSNFFFFRIQIILSLILLVALFLRIVNISNNPPSMYGDELTMVLDVNSILKTGHDITGKFLPLNFTMGGGRPVGYGYFSLPFVALFGQGAFSIRLLSVLSGVGITLLIYFLGKRLFSKRVGLFSAALLAVSPWDLSLSRGGFETHFALFLSLLMIVSFLYADKKAWLYIISALSFGLSINTYSTYKLSLPTFLPLLIWFSGFKKNLVNIKFGKPLALPVFILFFFISLLFYQALFNQSEARFFNLNVFTREETKEKIILTINEQRNLSLLSREISDLFNNKIWEYGFILGKSYLNFFSIDFLFLTGDQNPRHNMAASGNLYISQMILLFFGIGYLFKKAHFREMVFLTGWLLLAPIAATLLLETHALRGSFMLPPLIIVSALGLAYLWEFKKSSLIKALIFIVIAGSLIQFIFVAEKLYFISPNKYSGFWSYAARMASEMVIQNKNKYDYVFLSDRIDDIEFAYPIYAFIDPVVTFKQSRAKVLIGERQFIEYGNVYLGAIPDSAVQKFISSLNGSILYIGPESDRKYLEGSFDIIEGKDRKQALVIKTITR